MFDLSKLPPEPAFPSEFELGEGAKSVSFGMTIRDYAAFKAMQGDWASNHCRVMSFPDESDLKNAAALYYRMADAMLSVRSPDIDAHASTPIVDERLRSAWRDHGQTINYTEATVTFSFRSAGQLHQALDALGTAVGWVDAPE